MAMTPEEKRERHRARARRYRAENPEKVRQSRDQWKAKNPDYQQKWRAANPERDLENQRRWRDANRDKARDKVRQWQVNNPDKARESTQRHRHNGIRPEDMARMYEAQQGRCYLCGDLLPAERRKWRIDHDHRCCPQGTSCRDCRRGLACNNCNTLIGMAFDDPERLRRIAANLEAVLADVTRRLADRAVQGELFELGGAGEAS